MASPPSPSWPDILFPPDTPHAPVVRRERRTAKRLRFDFSRTAVCTLVIPERGTRESAWIADVSAGGVGMLVREPLEPGLAVYLIVTNRASGLTRTLSLQVCHTAPLSGMHFRIGCRFVTKLAADDVRALFFNTLAPGGCQIPGKPAPHARKRS